jgi:hypothetical protein
MSAAIRWIGSFVGLAMMCVAFVSASVVLRDDYFCDKVWQSTCVTNYCNPMSLPGFDCRYQEEYDDCECIPVA